jgi:aryl-alcohol dehydrogenase-like predicted oxidoreductase
LLAQGNDIVPIPGTRSIQRLKENSGAVNVELTTSDLAELNSLIPVNAASGEQYTEDLNFEV